MRSFAYSSADSKHARPEPTAPNTIPNRASLRHESGPRSVETSGRRFSSGTRTSWSTSSDVTDARSESFLWISGAEKPGMPRSTMNPWIASSSVRAQTIAMSAIVPFVIHILAPFRIQSEPSRRACVRIEPGSEPCVRLGQAEAADDLARVHRREPALLLLLRAELPDREHRERALNRDGASYARVAGLELHAREPVRDRARARKPVAVEMHAEEAELRELGEDLAREDALLEPVADLVEDVVAHELPDGVANRAFLVVEEGIDREVVERVEGGGTLGRGRHALDILRKIVERLTVLAAAPTLAVD